MFKLKNILPWSITAIAVTAAIVVPLGTAARAANTPTDLDSALVTTLETVETIEASGPLQAEAYAALSWKTGGTVETVPVQAGDLVQAGQDLMSLETASAPASLVSAQADLINARQQLDALQQPAGEARVAAQKNLTGAYSTWNKARDTLATALSSKSSAGDDDLYDSVVDARSELDNAMDAFPLAADPASQWYYWAARMQALGRTGDYDYTELANGLRAALDSEDADLVDDIVTAQNTYEQAVQDFAASVASYDTSIEVNQSVDAYLQTAEGLLSASQSAYETLVSPNSEDLSAAQARLAAAQANLNNLKIIAPFAGEVLSIEQHPGDVVANGSPALALADRSRLYIDAQVDEADIARVAAGNQATITLDILPGETLHGTVAFINPVGQTAAGLVRYSVRIEVDSLDQPLLLGATADVSIQVSETHAGLAVPVSAVQNDESGEYVMVIAPDGSTRRVAVESGEAVGDQVMISGDLAAGQRVLTEYQSSVRMPNFFGR